MKKSLNILTDIINSCLLITLLSLIYIGIISETKHILNPYALFHIIIIAFIYLYGIYISRNSFLKKEKSIFTKKLISNILLILFTSLFQYIVAYITGYTYILKLSICILLNTIIVFICSTIFYFSHKMILKIK